MCVMCTCMYPCVCTCVCVCVCVSVCMCVCHCAQCGPTRPLATFLLLQDMTFFSIPNPPSPHTHRVVFTLSIIIRSSCTCSCFSSSSLSFEKIPRKSCNKSMHTFVSKLHPPPTLHAKEGSTLLNISEYM